MTWQLVFRSPKAMFSHLDVTEWCRRQHPDLLQVSRKTESDMLRH